MKTNVNQYEDQTIHEFVISYKDPKGESDKVLKYEVHWPYDEEVVWSVAREEADSLIHHFEGVNPILVAHAWDVIDIRFRVISSGDDFKVMWEAN